MWCNEKGPFWAAKFLLVFICILIIRISTLKSPQYSHIYDRKIIFIYEKNIIILNLIFESGEIFFQHEHSVAENPTIEIDLLTLFDLFSIWIFRRYFFFCYVNTWNMSYSFLVMRVAEKMLRMTDVIISLKVTNQHV